jgi:hypothetical protein
MEQIEPAKEQEGRDFFICYADADLALLYCDQGRYGEAEPLYRRALAIAQSSLGDEHPSTRLIRANQANLLQEMRGRDGS